MFPDSFGANLAVFALGQAIAWTCLRTGLVVRGLVTMIALWVLADLALVLRFAGGETGWLYVASLAAMQAIALFEALRFLRARLRRRSQAFARSRERAFKAATVSFLRDELDAARAAFGDVVRADPWEMPARLWLGTIEARCGRRRRGRRRLVEARRLDRSGRFSDVLDRELRRL